MSKQKKDLAQVYANIEKSKARQRAVAAESRAKEAEAKVEELQTELDAAMRLSGRNKCRKIRAAREGKGDVAAIMVGSDWHLEEEVDPATVNGLNAFNLDLAKARSDRFFSKGVYLLDLVKKGPTTLNVNSLVVAILGDIISGYLREEDLETNLLSPTEALDFAYDQLSAGIDFLLENAPVDRIDLVCASGNHGRTCQKPRAASRTQNSFENLLYKMLRKAKQHPRLNWIIEEGYHVWHEVAGHQVRFHHGDAFRYQGGVGGLYIPVGRKIGQWNKARKADFDFFGHWHQTVDGGRWICNGSICGYNAYAVKIGAEFEEPQQTFALLDRRRGKILVAPIFVDGGNSK